MTNTELQNLLTTARTRHQAGDLAAAETIYRQILQSHPTNPDALHLLGVLAHQVDRNELAADLLNRAIAFAPQPRADFFNDLTEVHRCLLNLDTAIDAARRAIALAPAWPEPHLNLALNLLTAGRLAEAWPEYEWRWKSANLNTQRLQFTQPQWDGSPLNGRTLLLYAEQGLGDVIQCIRYAPLIVQRGGKVVVGCQPPLPDLIKTAPGVSNAISELAQTPPFDVQLSILALPRIFQTTIDTIPRTVPYLSADREKIETWRQTLAEFTTRFKVGIVWAGSPDHPNDRNRSLTLSALAPLSAVPNIALISLQKGPAAAQSAAPPPGIPFFNADPHLHTLADTAALMANLDLILSVDTSIVHLAGALARPTWTLLPYVPDWRWMLHRTDSPWYPTLKLFRQPTRHDWPSVISQVVQALQHTVAEQADK